jgi:hypothetical protein
MGTYQTTACGGSSDRACSACATCAPGTYEATACLPNANRTCVACTACGANQYETRPCSASSNRTCVTCATCGAGRYQAAACSANSDTVCGDCDANCSACTGPGACTACRSGYVLAGGSCALSGKTCASIHVADSAAPSGVYLLDPERGSATNAFAAYCDMTNDGGGWMKILQYHDAPYTPTSAAVGNIAVAATDAFAKLADIDVNRLAGVANYREFRFQGGQSSKKVFVRTRAYWNDPARGEGLVLSGTTQACEAVTNCAYGNVTSPRNTIDSTQWVPASAADDQDRYVTDYDTTPGCIGISTTQRCFNAGATTQNALIRDMSIWVREPPASVNTIVFYQLYEGTGLLANDTSGHGNNATILSGTWTTGHIDKALAGALRTGNPVPVTATVSVSLWVRRDGSGAGMSRILSWNNDGLELADLGAGSLGVQVPGLGWQPTGATLDATFHQVGVTAGGGTVTVYLDGVPKYAVPATVNLSGPMSIGTRWNTSESWNGAFDQVRVYDRLLTAADMAALAQE